MREVKLAQRECRGCSLRGRAGDDIYEDGVFNHNGSVVIELRVLYQLREVVRTGTPISTVDAHLPGTSEQIIRWLRASDDDRVSASR